MTYCFYDQSVNQSNHLSLSLSLDRDHIVEQSLSHVCIPDARLCVSGITIKIRIVTKSKTNLYHCVLRASARIADPTFALTESSFGER